MSKIIADNSPSSSRRT